MIVLLTNDDGIHAEGIQILGDTLFKEENINLFVIAPDHERSATEPCYYNAPSLRAEEVKFFIMKI